MYLQQEAEELSFVYMFNKGDPETMDLFFFSVLRLC